MGELSGIVFNCSRFLSDTKQLEDGKVTHTNCMTYSALLFPLVKVLNSAEILHLAQNILQDPYFAMFADSQTPSGTASLLGTSTDINISSSILNSTMVDGVPVSAGQPDFSVIAATPCSSNTNDLTSQHPCTHCGQVMNR